MPSQQNVFSLPVVLDGSQVYEKLGTSSLGSLYHVMHPRFGNCALKYLSELVIPQKIFVDNVLVPLKKLKELRHPNIARIYEVGMEEHGFILRELVWGVSLSEQFKMNEKFQPKEATLIVWDVAMGILGGYSEGIIYRNLKPGNIIILPNGRVRLVDVCLPASRLEYLAPEQWEKTASSTASDIYALGIIYYQMLTGCLPFKEFSGNNDVYPEMTMHHLADISDDIRKIIEKMLSRFPQERYQSPLHLMKGLRGVFQAMNVEVKSMSFSLEHEAELSNTSCISEKEKTKTSEFTSMMFSFKRSEETPNSREWDDTKTTRKMSYEEYFGEGKGQVNGAHSRYDEVYISKRSMEETPDKALHRITYIECVNERKEPMKPRLVHFPKDFEQQVLEHLQKTFRRETWLLKESDSPGEMEVEIDLEQSHILSYFYRYEDKLQDILQQLEVSKALPVTSAANEKYDIGSLDTLVSDDIADRNLADSDRDMAYVDTIDTGREDTEEVPSPGRKPLKTLPSISKDNLGAFKTSPQNWNELRTINMGQDEAKQQNRAKKTTQIQTTQIQTINMEQGEIVYFQEAAENVSSTLGLHTITDITVGGRPAENHKYTSTNAVVQAQDNLEFSVDFDNAYATMGWAKFIHEHNLKKDEQFIELPDTHGRIKKFSLHLNKLGQYQQEQENIARIKEFFQGDYDITELDRGGMGMVLKLTAKNDPTILSLRPENYWARQRFASYLRMVRDKKGQEIVYAEVPKGTEFVVKVAFESHEESLIGEARILTKVACDPHVCQTIIGAVQQGRLYTLNEKANQTQIGYYMMLEYAAQGDVERLYTRFPDGRLSPTIAFAIMYGMVQTLQKLEQTGIIHRDIKPQNILLDKNGVPKLSDFGLAITTMEESEKLTEERRSLLRIVDQKFLHIGRELEQTREKVAKIKHQMEQLDIDKTQEREKLHEELEVLMQLFESLQTQEEARSEVLKSKYRLTSAQENALKGKFAGSLYYAAPEQINPEAVLTSKCDIYQLGAVMFTLLTGKRPIQGMTSVEIMSKILYPVRAKITDFIKVTPAIQSLSDIIHKMMHHDAEQRPSANAIREELDRILFEHALEFKEIPLYEMPANISTQEDHEKWERRLTLAMELHDKCVKRIFSTIFQNQEMPSLNKDVQKIVFSCPHCGKKLHLYRYMDGKKGVCPGCRKGMVVKLT